MERNLATLYVIYSNEKPFLDGKTTLVPAFSPMQNYSELYIQQHILSQGVAPDDMVGFFHMRRYLDLSKIGVSHKQRPYRFEKSPQASDYSAEALSPQLSAYDIIAPIPEHTGLSVRKRFGQYPNHRSSDLDAVIEILLEKHPEYRQSVDRYLSDTKEYYGNLYVMSGRYFTEYATWLFDILSEFDRRVTNQLPRTPGYLSERLFGIWLTQKQAEGNAKITFAPRVHFWGYDGTTHHFKRDMYISWLLPPGSKRRFWLREVLRRGK